MPPKKRKARKPKQGDGILSVGKKIALAPFKAAKAIVTAPIKLIKKYPKTSGAYIAGATAITAGGLYGMNDLIQNGDKRRAKVKQQALIDRRKREEAVRNGEYRGKDWQKYIQTGEGRKQKGSGGAKLLF